MGRMKHSAAIFTTGAEPPKELQELRKFVVEKFRVAGEFGPRANTTVTPIMPAPRNGYCTFVILPDCSKEGWGASDTADEIRKSACLKAKDLGQISFINVEYGGDDDFSRILESY